MRSAFSILIDGLFILIVGFIFSLVIFTYLVAYPISIVLSAVFSLLFTGLFLVIVFKKKEKELYKKKDKEYFENLSLNLKVYSKTKIFNVIERVLELKKLDYKREKEYFFIESKKTFIYYNFDKDNLLKNVISILEQMKKDYSCYILYTEIDDENKKIITRLSNAFTFFDKEACFSILKDLDYFPPLTYKFKEKEKKKFKLVFNEKKKAKKYLAFGLFFVLLSTIVPIKWYYLSFGLIFLVIALFSRLYGKT